MPAAMLLAACFFRAMGFLTAVVDTDEGLYMLQAREWLRGGWPYVAVWDMHPPGAPAFIALALALLGESIAAVRLLGILCVAAAGWALYGLARAAGAPPALGLAAGIVAIAYSALLGGLATNTEILFAPLVVAAMALGTRGAARALRGEGGPGWVELAGMGLLIGLALAIKPVVAPEGCLAFALLTAPAWWRGALPTRRALAMAAVYAGLCALPALLLALAYGLRGELDAFLEGAVLAPFRYSSVGRLGAEEAFRRTLTAVLTLLWPILLAGVALAHWLGRGRRGAGGRLARIGLPWFAAATLGIVAPGHYYMHYFLLWLPPLALLAALGCWRLARLAVASAAAPRRRGLAFVLLVGAVALGAWRAEATYWTYRGIGLFAPDPVRQVSVALLDAGLRPGEPIFVVNYHPVVYVLARAGLPTRFVFPAHLSGAFGQLAGVDTDAELARVLAARPRFVVVDRGWWFSVRPGAAAIVTRALEEGYGLAATVAEERGPVEIWRAR